ncbi:hypothetical protein OC846_006214 [Tilletia horrida]|uniref:Uncharacterized protein n=1 Tax=Tilletia horrida TaxID=155126 RepID=A0AAN6JQW0_9BASI|nr:hypothetical protein OC845_006215 [Tilletia horrida]KAK0543993.1 hypothetical protein OC846_006214 [Tilletia horrida]KAK0560239.1 hypothetical protein OC861_006347 [Tilletia horrida]
MAGDERNGRGGGAGERKLFAFHLPKAWSYVPSTPASSASTSQRRDYAPLFSTESGPAGGGSRGHTQDEDDEDDDEMPSPPPHRPSLTSMTNSYMSSETSIVELPNEDLPHGPGDVVAGAAEEQESTSLEQSAAWLQSTSTSRIAISTSFVLLGAGVLLSFNALISPTEYFRSRFKATPYENTFSSWIVSVYNITSIVFGAHATATLGREQRKRREKMAFPVQDPEEQPRKQRLPIVGPAIQRISSNGLIVVVTLILLAVSTNFRYVPPPPQPATVTTETVKVPANSYFYFVMAVSVLLAASVSYLQNAVVAICSIFGPDAMSLMLTGQGVIGLSISLVQLAAAWAQSDPALQAQIKAAAQDPKSPFVDPAIAAARIFFSTGAALMLLTLISFFLLIRSQVWKEVVEQASTAPSSRSRSSRRNRRRSEGRDGRRSSSSRAEDADQDGVEADDGDASRPLYASQHSFASANSVASSVAAQREKRGGLLSLRLSSATRSSLARLWDIQRQTMALCLSIGYIFVLTLALFPALTARVQSVGYTDSKHPARWQTPLVFSALHFVAFNLADLIGRSLPGLLPSVFLVKRTGAVVVLTLSRTILLPLLRGCNLPRAAGASSPAQPQSFLRNDVAFFVIMFLMGASNGILATSIFIAGPGQVRAFRSSASASHTASGSAAATKSAQALSATVFSYWLTLGLAVGSALSFVSVKWA